MDERSEDSSLDARRGGAGPLLLQGGAEMQPGCETMDTELLGMADGGPVVVVLGAATPGRDHDRSAARALRYYEPLVPDRECLVAPHPQVDLDGCVATVQRAAVLVLPGGSPSRLHDGLHADGGRLAEAVRSAHLRGTAVSGSSAGAMVLCVRTALPDRRGGVGLQVVDGLGLIPGLALVHHSGSGDGGWRDPADPAGLRWGLPEQGGLFLHAGSVRALGRGRVRVMRAGTVADLTTTTVPLEQVTPG